MTINELNQNLDKIIADYEMQVGTACSFCSNDSDGEAFHKSHEATANALNSFKVEILTYLHQCRAEGGI